MDHKLQLSIFWLLLDGCNTGVIASVSARSPPANGHNTGRGTAGPAILPRLAPSAVHSVPAGVAELGASGRLKQAWTSRGLGMLTIFVFVRDFVFYFDACHNACAIA